MQAWRVGKGSTSFELQMGDVKDTWELDLSCIHSRVRWIANHSPSPTVRPSHAPARTTLSFVVYHVVMKCYETLCGSMKLFVAPQCSPFRVTQSDSVWNSLNAGGGGGGMNVGFLRMFRLCHLPPSFTDPFSST